MKHEYDFNLFKKKKDEHSPEYLKNLDLFHPQTNKELETEFKRNYLVEKLPVIAFMFLALLGAGKIYHEVLTHAQPTVQVQNVTNTLEDTSLGGMAGMTLNMTPVLQMFDSQTSQDDRDKLVDKWVLPEQRQTIKDQLNTYTERYRVLKLKALANPEILSCSYTDKEATCLVKVSVTKESTRFNDKTQGKTVVYAPQEEKTNLVLKLKNVVGDKTYIEQFSFS